MIKPAPGETLEPVLSCCCVDSSCAGFSIGIGSVTGSVDCCWLLLPHPVMVQGNSNIKPVSKTIVFRSMADRGNFNKNFFEIIYLFVSFAVTPFIPISFDLSVCAEKNYTMLNYEKQSPP